MSSPLWNAWSNYELQTTYSCLQVWMSYIFPCLICEAKKSLNNECQRSQCLNRETCSDVGSGDTSCLMTQHLKPTSFPELQHLSLRISQCTLLQCCSNLRIGANGSKSCLYAYWMAARAQPLCLMMSLQWSIVLTKVGGLGKERRHMDSTEVSFTFFFSFCL